MKNSRKTLSVVLAIFFILTAVAGCSSTVRNEMAIETTTGSTNKNSMDAPGSYKDGTNSSAPESSSGEFNKGSLQAGTGDESHTGITGTGYSGSNANTKTSLDILAHRKIIRNANISLGVDDFYKEYGNIQSMISGIGYVQEINTGRQYYNYKDERNSRIVGNIVIRVDARQFDNILNGIKGLGEITEDRIYTTDITDQFFDTEGRLKILRVEYDFLEEYMISLKDPDSIFKTRMRMTDLLTEIERLSGTLNKWSDLVELSTIYIQMTEKYPEDMGKNVNTYWDRLKNSVKNSLTGIVDALGDLVIFVIEAIPTLVVLAIIGYVGWLIGKRVFRKSRKGPMNKE